MPATSNRMDPIMRSVLDIIVARGNVDRAQAEAFFYQEDGFDFTLYERHIASGINAIEDQIMGAE